MEWKRIARPRKPGDKDGDDEWSWKFVKQRKTKGSWLGETPPSGHGQQGQENLLGSGYLLEKPKLKDSRTTMLEKLQETMG